MCLYHISVIYLLKRSKRNRQKHGLEEYEQVRVLVSMIVSRCNSDIGKGTLT